MCLLFIYLGLKVQVLLVSAIIFQDGGLFTVFIDFRVKSRV